MNNPYKGQHLGDDNLPPAMFTLPPEGEKALRDAYKGGHQIKAEVGGNYVKPRPTVTITEPTHCTGFLFTKRGTFITQVVLDYTGLTGRGMAPGPTAQIAMSRAVDRGISGHSPVRNLAGAYYLVVPYPPNGDAVMTS